MKWITRAELMLAFLGRSHPALFGGALSRNRNRQSSSHWWRPPSGGCTSRSAVTHSESALGPMASGEAACAYVTSFGGEDVCGLHVPDGLHGRFGHTSRSGLSRR
jgi:hypothetical protein